MKKSIHLLICIVIMIFMVACGSTKPTTLEEVKSIKTASGLSYKDIEKGSGKVAKYGSKVSIHYILKNPKGEIIENSYTSNIPLVFTIGSDAVIKGLDEGVSGMAVGGKRVINIPQDLGFQGRRMRAFDTNEEIVIEAELLKVE